ncbi:Proline--tRNA ligase [Frankliniella fusca]|uniref:Proline--tRNA ligase n=1 Tax=Frankliniella fusca TaxID=407009 RepID=A0AAE1H1Y9_9NEOP|nr:Proline--tRNA ligase [Frankliniella fusca]
MRQEMQRKRNLGQEYIQINGKIVQARERKPSHVCTARKCHLIVTPAVGETLFNEYWGQGSYERRVSYICAFSTPERHRKRDLDSDKNKEVVWQYFFTINGERHQTDTFLRRCQAKVRETVSGIAPKERRGIATPQHAHTPDFKDLIRAHINKFPAYVSHYCRKQTKQKYLSSTLSVKTMHNKFLEQNAEKNIKCSYSAYYRVFRKMGLKFKQPPQDTCNKCDELKAKIKFSKSEEDENRLKTEHALHLRKAEEAYKLKRIYKNLSKEDKSAL